MQIEYKIDRLPMQFIALGYMLLLIGFWRIFANDWRGILFLLISIVFIFLRKGIIIDVDRKRLKKYKGLLLFKYGNWEDVSQMKSLRIIKTRETQNMNVITISRTESFVVCRLYICLPDRTIELLSGEENMVLRKAQTISTELHIPLLNSV